MHITLLGPKLPRRLTEEKYSVCPKFGLTRVSSCAVSRLNIYIGDEDYLEPEGS